jgi:nucleoside-diphosphate-sugar epimerase
VKGLPVEIIYGDCREKDSLRPGVKDVDLVFHLAGATRAIDAKTYFAVNALGTENLVQACLEHNTRLQKFIYLSSQAAAGPGWDGGKKKESDQTTGRGIGPVPGPRSSSPDPSAFCDLRAQG